MCSGSDTDGETGEESEGCKPTSDIPHDHNDRSLPMLWLECSSKAFKEIAVIDVAIEAADVGT